MINNPMIDDPMSADEAREYGPQWGSYMRDSDPGYIMYTAIPPERAEHRDEMVAWLHDRCLLQAREGCPEHGDEYEYSDVEMLYRMIAYLEALAFPPEGESA